MESLKPTQKLGEVLTQCGLVTDDDVGRALELARSRGVRLGDALVELGVLTQDKVAWAVGLQFHLATVDVEEEMIDWELLRELPLEALFEFQILPMALVNGSVHAVVADPTLPGLAEAFERLFPGRPVEFSLASFADIGRVLRQASLRRADAARAPVEGPHEAETLVKWMDSLAGGTLDRISVFPDGSRDGAFAIVRSPEDPSASTRLSRREAESLLELLDPYRPAREFVTAGLRRLARPAMLETRGRAISALTLEGWTGPLLVLHAIPSEPSAPGGCSGSTVVLAGPDPAAIKTAVFDEAAASATGDPARPGLSLALEARTDRVVPGLVQSEFPRATERLAVFDLLRARAAARHVILELDRAADLGSIPPGGPDGATVVAILREPAPEALRPGASGGLDVLILEGPDDAIRARVRAILGGEAR